MDPNQEIPAVMLLSTGERLHTTMTPAQLAYSVQQDSSHHWVLLDTDGAAMIVPMRHIVSIAFETLDSATLDDLMRASVAQ